jgi:hypothetical protein
MILAVVNPVGKTLPEDNKVELIFDQAIRLKGTILEGLSENRYQFKSLEGELEL